MMQPQSTPEVVERVRRVESSLVVEPPVWSREGEHAALAERMAYHRVPGLSVAVINNGQIEWVRGYGAVEAGRGAPVTPTTVFQACSISKHVAMVGTMRLVEDGLLDLDEDANRYLTAWKLPPNGPWQPRITLRQLLGHTAGLVYNWYRGFRRGEPVPTLLEVLEGRPPANTPPVRAVMLPGSRFRYSGSHYSVLQQLLVDTTGTPFPELLHALVFAPLGMRDSSFDQGYPDSRAGSVAVGHYLGGEPVHGKWRVIPEMAGAGLWTTPADLARLALEIQRAHRGLPTTFLTKQIVDQALTPQVDEGFGLGAELQGKGASLRFGHSGGNIGYACLSTAYAARGLGAVAMTNGEDGRWVIQELFRAIAREYGWPDYEPQRIATEVDGRVYDAYVGEYELRPGMRLTIRREEDALLLEAPGQPPLEVRPCSEIEFFSDALNSEVAFSEGAGGEVTGLVLRQEGQEAQARKVRRDEQ